MATLLKHPSIDLSNAASVHYNLNTAALYEHALSNDGARLNAHGALVVETGKFTGRSPKDRFIVKDDTTSNTVDWGAVNQPMEKSAFSTLKNDMNAALKNKTLYVQDLYVGADERYRVPIRVITEYAWHSLFARIMFVRPEEPHNAPAFTVLDLPSFSADPTTHSSRSSTVIALDLSEKLVLIANTEYAGEIKKSIFSAMNYALPEQNVMPMHCSANHNDAGQTALFFGLSGTGKTTLSADSNRTLIGDDEHGWSDAGVFNFEGGCYAKVIHLSQKAEPEIYATTRRFGTILENVVMDEQTRVIDFDNGSKTENTRAAYPIEFIPNASRSGVAGHPDTVIFLTADAFGVLPPISKLSTAQALYHFLSGYTAKVAGTERGVTEPQATFSTCFGSPFMPLAPGRYAELLGEKLNTHNAQVWLVNTGWIGGPYGTGSRIDIAYTRAMISAALDKRLLNATFETHPVFGLSMPTSCPNVPAELLNPRNTWADKDAYDAQARKLASMFNSNFEQFKDTVSTDINAAAPNTN